MSKQALPIALTLALAACVEEPLTSLVPHLSVGDPDVAGASLCQSEGTQDCAYDFGSVSVGDTRRLSFTLQNTGTASLRVLSLSLAEGAFAVEQKPAEVDVGGAEVVVVSFSPSVEGPAQAVLEVASDAPNAARISIALTGNGAAEGAGAIASSAGCDFGAIGVGVRALCTISVENVGDAPLTISDLRFSADTPSVFEAENLAAPPYVIQPGTALSATYAAVPAEARVYSGTLLVDSDDAATPQLALPFTVRGSTSPTAVARVLSVNGAAVAAGAAVEPLDDVVLSGDQSAGGGSASVVSYAWTIVEQPQESSATLSAPSSRETGFVFSSAAGNVSGIDVAGTFRVRLQVTDSDGAASENEAIVTLQSIPTEGLHVQLSWDAAENDLDLHLGNGFGIDWCSRDDCYYDNCADAAGVNWDGVAGYTSGDPRLDIDDTNGFGPENIQMETPPNGSSYVVGVHAYSGEGGAPGFAPTRVTVKIFVGGALRETFQRRLDARNQFWKVARVETGAAGTSIRFVDQLVQDFQGCE